MAVSTGTSRWHSIREEGEGKGKLTLRSTPLTLPTKTRVTGSKKRKEGILTTSIYARFSPALRRFACVEKRERK